MRIPTRAALVLALAAGACKSSSAGPSAGVSAPTAVVAFQGITARYTGVHPYVAVSSGRGGELRIIDPTSDRPVLGPTLVFPLSVPADARPLKLAAASLGDGGADLLAVALPGSAGAPAIEIVETWSAENRIATAITLPGLGADTEIISLAAGPVPGVTGRARLVAGLATSAGFELAVVDVVRATTPATTPTTTGAVTPAGPAALQPLAFTPVDLAFSPAGDLLFVATTDPIAGGVLGVAQLAVGDPATTWPVTALDARAGTTHVAAAVVAERTVTETANGVVIPATSEKVFGAPALRVYASLDPAGCGDTKPIRCGIATLVPGVGLAEDPSRVVASTITTGADSTAGMPYRAPIEYLGVTAALAMAPDVANLKAGSPCDVGGELNPGGPARTLLAPPGSGQRCTTASGVVASSDGNTYVMDLGRFEIPSETSVLVDASQRTRVTSATSTIPAGTTGATLGLADSNGQPISNAANLAAAVQVTPGFTPNDTFRVTYQGFIPGLQSVFGVVRRLSSGELVLTGQADSGSRNSAGEVNWTEGLRLSSAVFSVHAGDVTQIETVQIGVCPGDVASDRVDTEVAVKAVIAPNPAVGIPGGALQLEVDEAALPCFAAGIDALPGKFLPVQFNVRAGGLILTGDALGYAGRPDLNGGRFALEYVVANDKSNDGSTDRNLEPENEPQLLARKARRRFYPAEYACGASGCSGFPGFTHALASGPMLAFSVTAPGTPPRDAQLVIVTSSGYLAFTSRPTGAEAPVGAAPIDRTTIDPNGNLAVRWYVGYSNDQVFVFGPAEAPNQAFSIR